MTTSGTAVEFSVYKITNLVNGKFYIGITGKGVSSRWRRHVYNAKAKSKYGRLPAAILKYGKENFQIETIEVYATAAEAKAAEIRFIKDLCPQYNATLGGDGTTGHTLNMAAREKARQRMLGSKLNLGRHWTDEQKLEMSKKKKGCEPPPVSSLMAETRAENMRRAAKNRRKKVICLTDNRAYDSSYEASRAYGLHDTTVASVCSGRRKAVYGLKFAYLEAA